MRKIFSDDYNIRLILSSLFFLLGGIGLYFLGAQLQNFIILRDVINSVGSVLIVSGVYNVIYEYILKKSLFVFIIEKLGLKNSMANTGVVEILPKIDASRFLDYIGKTNRQIDIVHAYGDTWTKNNIEAVKEACLLKKIEIRVFLLSPESLFCVSIAKHYNRDADSMEDSIRRVTERWMELKKAIAGSKSTITLYYFDGNPVHSLYRFDDYIIAISNKIHNEFTFYLPTLICKKEEDNDKNLYNLYLKEIEHVLGISIALPLEKE